MELMELLHGVLTSWTFRLLLCFSAVRRSLLLVIV